MSRRRRDAGDAEPAERPWVVFLTCRAKLGAPIRLAGRHGAVRDRETPLSFASEGEAASWAERARRSGYFANFVLTPGRLR